MEDKMIGKLDCDITRREFSVYKSFSEKTIDLLKDKIVNLEKKIDYITNVMEVSKYINSNVSEDDLIQKINDMIIGIMGVEYSTIYIMKKDEMVVEATNLKDGLNREYEENYYDILDQKQSFILNCKSHNKGRTESSEFHSIVGVPILLKDQLLGYIVLEHSIWEYFGKDHINFLGTISNHIGIALENNSLYMKIKESSIKDPLLGIYNRKFFFDRIENRMAENSENEFAIVMMDIDDFKKLNDGYGHQFGDNVLSNMADIIQKSIGSEDLFARYGGEELIIYIHSGKYRDTVVKRVENLRKAIQENEMKYRDKKVITTMSFGIAFYPTDGNSIDRVVSVADKNMYISKNTGKNRVTYSSM